MSDCAAAGGEIMSVALAEHTGPWTADDVEALPDAGDHARFEVYEGGVLVVRPAPGVGHQRASYRLHRALSQAAVTAGADVEVLEAVNVALPGGKLLVADVVVVAAGAVDETTTRLPYEAVLAVVEVVSPSTVSIDRAVKPVMYAEAGIPPIWRKGHWGMRQPLGTPNWRICSIRCRGAADRRLVARATRAAALCQSVARASRTT